MASKPWQSSKYPTSESKDAESKEAEAEAEDFMAPYLHRLGAFMRAGNEADKEQRNRGRE
jgi:hypothetical protein